MATNQKTARSDPKPAARDDDGLEQYYTLADSAAKLRMSRQTLYTHILAGRIKPRRFGRYSVLSEKEIARFAKGLRSIQIGGRERMVLAYPSDQP